MMQIIRTNESIVEKIKSTEWHQDWNGPFPLLDVSMGNESYITTIPEQFGKTVSPLFLTYKEGIASAWLPLKQYEKLGTEMARRTLDIGYLEQWIAKFKKAADEVFTVIRKDPEHFLTELDDFCALYQYYSAYQVATKAAFNFLPLDADPRTRALLEEGRRYSETMYTESVEMFSKVAERIASAHKGHTKELVLMMTVDELRDYLKSSTLPGVNELAERHICSGIYWDTNGVRVLPASTIKKIEKAWRSTFDGKLLKGTSAYKGRVKGTCHVVWNYKNATLEKGEILVTGMTDPNFVPLMQKAAAIITDGGGMLSHAAIMARELGTPCIIGTKFATQVLHDGDLVEVDADNGVVNILQRDASHKEMAKRESAFTQMREREYAIAPYYWISIVNTSLALEKLYKINAGTSRQVFSNGRATSVFSDESFKVQAAQIAHGLLHDEQYFSKIKRAEEESNKKARALTRRYDTVVLHQMPFKRLMKMAIHLRDAFVAYDSSGMNAWFTGGDEFKSQLLKTLPISEEMLNTVAVPRTMTHVSRMEFDVLSAAVKGDTSDTTMRRLAKKYFWIPFGYEGPVVWDAEYFKNLVREKMLDQEKVRAALQEIGTRRKRVREESAKIMREHVRDARHLHGINVLRAITQWTDDRKFVDFQIFYQYDRILKEIAERFSVTREELKYLFTHELLLLEKDLNSIIEQARWRMNHECMVIGYKGTVRIATQEELDFVKKHTFRGDTNVTSFSGVVGCVGEQTIYRARVKVMLSPKEHAKIHEGEFLVTAMTSPNFLPAMKTALGFITDEGGVTSHAAIIAREMNKPSIIGTKVATKILKDGDLVEVDTEEGIVTILDRA